MMRNKIMTTPTPKVKKNSQKDGIRNEYIKYNNEGNSVRS